MVGVSSKDMTLHFISTNKIALTTISWLLKLPLQHCHQHNYVTSFDHNSVAEYQRVTVEVGTGAL